MLIAIAAVDLTGIGVIAYEQWCQSAPATPVALLVQLPRSPKSEHAGPVVVTKDGTVVSVKAVGRAQRILIRLQPDTYRLWRDRSCSKVLVVSDSLLQASSLRC